MLSRQAANINLRIRCVTRSGFEPMSYRTRGEHANYYTTIELLKLIEKLLKQMQN